MKKTLIAILMAMLVLPVIALTARAENNSEEIMPTLYTQEVVSDSTLTTEPEEEKISNPGEIKNFIRIRKIGNSLYGIRRVNGMMNDDRQDFRQERQENSDFNQGKQGKQGNNGDNLNNAKEYQAQSQTVKPVEEKILSLDDIKYFTKIRKIGTALYGVRMKAQGVTTISADAIACVKMAMTKKDDAVLSAFDTYAATAKIAMITRNSAQLAALDITVSSDRAKAMNAAMIANKKAKDEANRLRNQSVKTANDVYKTDLKACRVNIGSDLDTSDVDSSL